jgi:hypothetical protein
MEQKNEENVYIEKKIFIFSVFLLATLIITAVMISYLLLNNKIIESSSTIIEFEPDVPAFEIKDEATTKKEIYYVLKEYNGKIGVYENESLIYTLDIYVFTLPEVDKQLLKDGIIVSTKEKLYELIEEYY